MVLLATSVFAEAVVEEEVTEITILCAQQTYEASEHFRAIVDRFHLTYPDVVVRALPLDLSTVSTMSMDALDMAGTAPNVYWDYTGRVGKYMLPGYALPLDDYIADLDKFYPGVLDQFRRGGVLYGMPDPGEANGMVINLKMMDEIGYTVPDNWTVDDFLEMCELVKQFYGGEKFGTFMYAATMSGDYQINTWWGAFGAHLYASGDYSRTTIRETGGAKVHEFYQTLVRNGYIQAGAASRSDGETFALWGGGMFAAVPFFPSWVEPYRKIGLEQGVEEFPVVFVEFPSATGEPVEAYATGSSAIVIETGTAADAIAAHLVESITSVEAQAVATRLGGLPANRSDATVQSDNVFFAQTGAIAAANGLQDVGFTTELYSAVRAQHYPILARVLNLELTPEESIALYEEAVNEVLSY